MKFFVFIQFFLCAALSFGETGEARAVLRLVSTGDAEIFEESDFSAYSKRLDTKFGDGRKMIEFSAKSEIGKWREMRFCVAPKNDSMALILSADSAKIGGKNIECAVEYTAIKIDGKPVENGDFSQGLKGWYCAPSNEYRVKLAPSGLAGGKACVVATRTATLTRRFSVEPDKPHTVSLMFRPLGSVSASLDTPLPFGDLGKVRVGTRNQFGNDGGLSGVVNFLPFADGKIHNFGGIDFAVGDVSKSGALIIRGGAGGELDLKGKKFHAPFLYLLHTGSNLGRSSGAVAVYYSDGSRKIFNLRDDENVSDFRTVVSKRNALPVLEKPCALYISKFGLDPTMFVEKIRFAPSENAAVAVLGATLSERDILTTIPVETDEKVFVKADLENMYVKKGSALCFGIDESLAPAGKFGRAIVNAEGKIAFENRPDVSVRFFGLNGASAGTFVAGDPTKTKENIVRRVAAIRAQGYNIATVWYGSSISRAKEKLRAEMLDAADFLFAELKRNGIYVQYRMATPDMGQQGYTWDTRDDAKLRCIMGDPEMLKILSDYVSKMMTRVNPYTQTTLANDTAVVSVNYFGEMNSGYERMMSNVPYLAPLAERQWRKWLEKKYANVTALNAAWKLREPLKSIGDVSIKHFRIEGRPIHDWYLFIAEKHCGFNAFCRELLSKIGYRGLVFEGDGSRRATDIVPRATSSDICAADIYYSHPHGGFGAVGCSVNQESAVGKIVPYFCAAASIKIAGRPTIIMEHNYCHWNPYSREGGLIFPAYGSYQGFSQLMIHSAPVREKPVALGAFSAGSSPVMRANEVLTYFLFLRGDVAESKRRVDLKLPNKWFEQSPEAYRALNQSQTRAALMCGFAVTLELPFPTTLLNSRPKKADAVFLPSGFAEIFNSDWFSDVLDSASDSFSLDLFAQSLRGKGILSKSNVTDPKNGVFQTDTEEITLRAADRLLKVVSPKSEAVSLLAGGGEKLGTMEVLSTSIPAVAALCSVDNLPLSKSKRMLLVYSTEDRNTGETFTSDGFVLLKKGTLPVRSMAGKLRVKLALGAGVFKLYPLCADGTRRAELKLSRADGAVFAEIDTSTLANGATPFFEIVEEK